MNAALAGLLAIAGSVVATIAPAQGPPPFDLPDDASRSTQVVRMQLGLIDPEEASPNSDEMTADSQFQATLNRTALGNGDTGTGHLVMFPLGIDVSLQTASGVLLTNQPQDGGSATIMAFESPSVTPSIYAPYIDVGTYYYDITCSAVYCSQWLESPIESRAESSYDHSGGTLEVDASVITPDYGVTDDTEELYHGLRSTAFARVGDWIYVTGAGATATVTIAATLPVALDAPDDNPDDGSGPSEWITQGSGDLRLLGCNSEVEPWVSQRTQFRFDIELTRWAFEEVCEEEGEGGEPVCNDEWVDTSLGTQTVSREFDMRTNSCDTGLTLDVTETGALPGSTQLEAETPTNQWVQLYVTTSTDAACEGAMACDLDARTTSPIVVSVTSPNGELVAWRGLAGLTRVPEPGSAASLAVVVGALAALARRRDADRPG